MHVALEQLSRNFSENFCSVQLQRQRWNKQFQNYETVLFIICIGLCWRQNIFETSWTKSDIPFAVIVVAFREQVHSKCWYGEWRWCRGSEEVKNHRLWRIFHYHDDGRIRSNESNHNGTTLTRSTTTTSYVGILNNKISRLSVVSLCDLCVSQQISHCTIWLWLCKSCALLLSIELHSAVNYVYFVWNEMKCDKQSRNCCVRLLFSLLLLPQPQVCVHDAVVVVVVECGRLQSLLLIEYLSCGGGVYSVQTIHELCVRLKFHFIFVFLLSGTKRRRVCRMASFGE